jgi:two-component system response regulator HydG
VGTFVHQHATATPPTAARARVLLADDDPTIRQALRRALDHFGMSVSTVEDGRQAQNLLDQRSFDLVLTDLAMPHADGFAVLETSLRLQPRAPVIMMTAVGLMSECVRAMRAGAYDFVHKPYDLSTLRATLRAALDPRRTRPAGALGVAQMGFIGESRAAHDLRDMIGRVAGSSATVLITGETGTGKEVAARALHQASGRAAQPLVTLNCGSIPEGLIESELFGHVAGAFTGATAARDGRVRQADGGSLFLDEIGDLPLALQARLLRVLQERTISPLGGAGTCAVDVRFIAATNRDLPAMVRAGQFREDLFFRLNVVPLELPALRERAEDIPLLAAHFLAKSSKTAQTARATHPGPAPPLVFSEAALTAMQVYPWPGNVRELEHLIERMVILDRDGIIDVDDLPARLRTGAAGCALDAVAGLGREPIDLGSAVAGFERALIENALRRTGGNRSQAAVLLGIGRTTLLDKIKRGR